MTAPLLESGTAPLLEATAAFTERRHAVLAGNLANIDTPGYRPRDLDTTAFRDALADAVERRRRPASRNPPDDPSANLFADDLLAARERPGGFVQHDGAVRGIEGEVAAVTKNTLSRQFAVRLLAAQMRMLEAAITERP